MLALFWLVVWASHAPALTPSLSRRTGEGARRAGEGALTRLLAAEPFPEEQEPLPAQLAAEGDDTAEPSVPGLSGDAQRVLVSRFEVSGESDSPLVWWETAFEAGVLSYDVYRVGADRRTRVNGEPIRALDTPIGGNYFASDTTAPSTVPSRYELEVLLITGRSMVVAASDPAAIGRGAPAVHNHETQGAEAHSSPMPARLLEVRRQPSLTAAPASVDLTAPGNTAAVKILTTASGIHFLSAARLATLLSRTEAEVAVWIQGGQLALSTQGEAVTYIPGSGTTGAGLFFYAEPHRNNYTSQNVYWLRGGRNIYGTLDGGGPLSPATTAAYQAVVEAEQDAFAILSVVSDPEEDFWAWQGLTAGVSTADTWSFPPFSLSHVVQAPGTNATLRVRATGGSRTSHRVRALCNGYSIGERTWEGLTPTVLEFTIPSTFLRNATSGEGANVLTLSAVLGPSVTVSRVYVQAYELAYPRSYRAAGNRLEAGAQGNRTISAAGFTGADITVLEITDPRQPRLLTNVRVEGSGANYTATFRSDPVGRYALFRPSVSLATTAVTADRLSVVYPADLANPATRASYVLVAPTAFLDAAQQLAAYRASKLRTKVVALEDIYHEFSHGLVTPHAIARFVRTAYQRWAFPPRFLVLVGDGTYDYRNLQSRNDNFVPPLMIATDFGLFTSDSLYGDVLGDQRLRVAVGRIPIVASAEMTTVLAKLEAYESRMPSQPPEALLLADRPDAGGDFVAGILALERYLSPPFACERLFPPPYPVGDNPPPINVEVLRTAVQHGLNRGVELLNYVGHGAFDRFGKDRYLSVTDVPGLANAARLPVVAAMTCVAGQYSNPGSDCLAETLVMTPRVGAVATVAPTGLSYDNDAAWINRRFVQALAQTTSGRLGDVLLPTFSLYQAGATRRTPVWMYNLIGDPGLELRFPEVGHASEEAEQLSHSQSFDLGAGETAFALSFPKFGLPEHPNSDALEAVEIRLEGTFSARLTLSNPLASELVADWSLDGGRLEAVPAIAGLPAPSAAAATLRGSSRVPAATDVSVTPTPSTAVHSTLRITGPSLAVFRGPGTVTYDVDFLGRYQPVLSMLDSVVGLHADDRMTGTLSVVYQVASAEPAPVVLRYFGAQREASGWVAVHWQTIEENQLLGFQVERQDAPGSWRVVTPGLIAATGTNQLPVWYRFEDREAPASAGLRYRLRTFQLDGQDRLEEETPLLSGLVGVIRSQAGGLNLWISGPPGARVGVEATRSLSEAAWVEAAVLDLDGQGQAVVPLGVPAQSSQFYRLRQR